MGRKRPPTDEPEDAGVPPRVDFAYDLLKASSGPTPVVLSLEVLNAVNKVIVEYLTPGANANNPSAAG